MGKGASWGVRTGLSFDGFVHFLRLCEKRVSAPKGEQIAEIMQESSHVVCNFFAGNKRPWFEIFSFDFSLCACASTM